MLFSKKTFNTLSRKFSVIVMLKNPRHRQMIDSVRNHCPPSCFCIEIIPSISFTDPTPSPKKETPYFDISTALSYLTILVVELYSIFFYLSLSIIESMVYWTPHVSFTIKIYHIYFCFILIPFVCCPTGAFISKPQSLGKKQCLSCNPAKHFYLYQSSTY